MSETSELETYRDELDHHDWFYYFSDDARVYDAGAAEGSRLIQKAVEGSDDMKRAYNAAHRARFDTESFIKWTAPFPEVEK